VTTSKVDFEQKLNKVLRPNLIMKVLKVSIDEELDQKLRERAYQIYGNSKGALSKTIEDALKLYLYIPIKDLTPQMSKNIELYEKMKGKLDEEEFDKFGLISEGEFIGIFDSWEDAQNEALIKKPNAEHGLIWQVGVKRKKKARLGWRMKVAGP
jgi:hypothetical protein